MAKTLVIAGADYSANKLEKVSFGGSIPCTDISLSESSYTITDYDPVDIEYTLTPSDTTDLVSFVSSDTDVVAIENGKIKVVGIGTATITATCGSCTDTASVAVNLEYIPDVNFGMYSHSEGIDFVSNGASVTNRILCMGTGAQEGEYISVPGSTGYNAPVIKLPKNTASITISFSSTSKLYDGDAPILYWMKDESCGGSGSLADAALYVSEEAAYNAYRNSEKTFNVPSTADSFLYFFRLSSNAGTGETAESLTEDVGLSITFNTTSAS